METFGVIAALASAASWALATVIFDRIGKVMSFAAMTFFKGLFSIVLIAVLAMFSGGLTNCNTWELTILALSGVIGIAIGDTLFFRSLQDLGAKVQVLYFMVGQVVTMILSFLLLGDVLSLQEYIGALILLGGVVVVIWGTQDDHPNKRRGIIGGFISIMCFSISTIMVKIAIGEIDVVSATFYRMVAGTICVMFVGFTTKKLALWVKPFYDIKLLGLFLFNVVVITLGGFMLSMFAIKHISVSIASVLSTTEPVFVLIFAYFINKERSTKKDLIGAAITICGLLIIILNG